MATNHYFNHYGTNFYANKFATSKSLSDLYQVGIPEHFNEFMYYIRENPFLLKIFKDEDGLRKYVKTYYDGLPF